MAANRGQAYVDAMLARNGGLTSAKLVTLVLQLRDDSRFMRKMNGRPALRDALLAGVFNMLGGAHIEKFSPIDLDDPDAAWYDIQRATADVPERDGASDSELDAMMRGEITAAQLN